METFWNIALALCVGISVGSLTLLVLELLCGVRLEGMHIGQSERRLPFLLRVLWPLATLLKRKVESPYFAKQLQIAERQLGMAGMNDSISAVEFVATRLAAWLVSLVLLVLCSVQGSLLLGLLCGAVLAIYPSYWLNQTIRRRHREIVRALPTVLDLLTLSIEAGKDFMSSLRDILARRKLDALGEELERAFQEIQLGKKRTTALREMNDRVQQDEFSSVIHAIIQAEELGVSIGQLLRIQGDMLRNKRFSRAEKLANEAPVKMLAPMFLFIFPAVVVILGVALGSQLLNLL